MSPQPDSGGLSPRPQSRSESRLRRPQPRGPRVARTFGGCAAALACITLLLFISPQPEPTTAYAASGDDDAWQGTITVVYTTHSESDTTEANVAFREHKVHRYQLEQRAIYSDFRLQPENEERKAWIGGARVNLTMNEQYHKYESKFWPSPQRPIPDVTEELGLDTTASGSTVAQGRIRFGRYTDQEDRKKTKCHIDVDAQDGWRDRPELKVPVTGRSWSKITPPPEATNDIWDKAVNEKKTIRCSFWCAQGPLKPRFHLPCACSSPQWRAP